MVRALASPRVHSARPPVVLPRVNGCKLQLFGGNIYRAAVTLVCLTHGSVSLLTQNSVTVRITAAVESFTLS